MSAALEIFMLFIGIYSGGLHGQDFMYTPTQLNGRGWDNYYRTTRGTEVNIPKADSS